jgi:hypothetical protein
MNMCYESATRRNFMLASSAQILFVLKSDVASGQSPPDLSQHEKESMDRLIERLTFVHASDFTEVFWELWGEKVDLTLAIVEVDVREALSELLVTVHDALSKEYGADNPIPRDSLHLVLAGTIYVQNVIFAISTEAKYGTITITHNTIQKARGITAHFIHIANELANKLSIHAC